jgi:hypothetical protein
VTEIAAENNSTTLFPIPIDLFRPMIEKAAQAVDSLSGDLEDAGEPGDDEADDEGPASLPGSRMELRAGGPDRLEDRTEGLKGTKPGATGGTADGDAGRESGGDAGRESGGEPGSDAS